MTLFEELLNQLEEAAVNLSWKGASPPGNRDTLQIRYDAKRESCAGVRDSS